MKDRELRERVKKLEKGMQLLAKELGWNLDIGYGGRVDLYTHLGGDTMRHPVTLEQLRIKLESFKQTILPFKDKNTQLLIDYLGLEVFEGIELRKKISKNSEGITA